LLASHYAGSFKSLELLNQDLEQIVKSRTGQLVTANRVKDKLLSIVSHDIKSPLNSLRGILTIYNKGSINADEFKFYSKRIEDDLIKTSLLVDSILYWTSTQLNGVQPKFENIDLKEIARENIDLFRTIASNKGLIIKNDVPENYVINFDRNILNLSLRNLISNAIKFSHKEEEIIVHCEASEDGTFIRIIDFGVGMSRELIKSLLEMHTAKSSLGTNNEKGTGLGLSFCREYLNATGAELNIESVVGKGSTFTISIPAKHSVTNSINLAGLSLKSTSDSLTSFQGRAKAV
jgi:signal transduction histidine kinase